MALDLYKGWRMGSGDGAGLTLLQLLARLDSEYTRLINLGRWKTSNSNDEIIALKAQLNSFKKTIAATKREGKNPNDKKPTNATNGDESKKGPKADGKQKANRPKEDPKPGEALTK